MAHFRELRKEELEAQPKSLHDRPSVVTERKSQRTSFTHGIQNEVR